MDSGGDSTLSFTGLEVDPLLPELNELTTLLNDAKVTILDDKATTQEFINTARKYHLLPSDAIIALTCKHYGIKKILTFDGDFKRVPRLTVIP